ncbi:MAG: hypothetical protein Q8M24_16455, partial [Pseudolabrys sp.]|nr:hypothetical protein [Pseudolabrys sp.]
MNIIQLASRTRATAQAAPPQVTTATIFQFTIKAKPAPRDKWDGLDWLTEEEKAKCRANSAARFAKRDARERFGKRLHVVRTILGLSVEAAASAAGIKPLSFTHYERGCTEMRTARFMAFVNHPTVALRGFLLTWLLEDGAP